MLRQSWPSVKLHEVEMTSCRSGTGFRQRLPLPLRPGRASDAADENVENGLRHAFDLGLSNAPARKVAVDVHAGKAIDKCAAGDLDLLQLARAELALLECIRQHLLGQRDQLGIVARQRGRAIVVEMAAARDDLEMRGVSHGPAQISEAKGAK